MLQAENPAPLSRAATVLDQLDGYRPELHRYCSRLLGSVIDGEDVVQDVMVKALSLGALDQLDNLRAWLFKAAHNRAIDLLRQRARRSSEPLEAAVDVIDTSTVDPSALMERHADVMAGFEVFLGLPITQRSALILKDVLDLSLAETADMLGLSIDAVKALVARGRSQLEKLRTQAPILLKPAAPSSEAVRYAALFNARDWDGLRQMLADDVKLNQARRARRQGRAEVSVYFSYYDRYEPIRLVPAYLGRREVLAVFNPATDLKPSSFMWLEWHEGKIVHIHDYRYAGYVMDGAEVVLNGPTL